VDVLKIDKSNRKLLTSKDRGGYPHCQRLAKRLVKAGTEILRAPSARHAKGACVAIFDKQAIAVDQGHLQYLRLILTQKECRILQEEKIITF
jgi:hypothetical protein